jgi:class 3 adenylate cyclase
VVAAVEPEAEPPIDGEPVSAPEGELSALDTFEAFLRETAIESGNPEAMERVHRILRRHDRSARWVDRVVSRQLSRRGFDEGRIRSSIALILDQVQERHTGFERHTDRDGTITILFSDIAGSTPLAQQMGDDAWIEVISAHNAIVREQMFAHRGREISNRGDGFMITFLRPDEAVGCAIGIQRRISAHAFGDLPAPVELHIGIHRGTPAKHEGNFYGTDVNIAARIADHIAQAGEILVSRAACDGLQRYKDAIAPDCRQVTLDGLSGVHDVFEVRWRESAAAPEPPDGPV